MKVSSSTATNTYAWLGQFPKMQEWVGDRQIKNMQAQGMTIENKLFESTVAVPRTAIEDDQVGLFTPMVKQAAQSAAELPDDLVFSLLKKVRQPFAMTGRTSLIPITLFIRMLMELAQVKHKVISPQALPAVSLRSMC